MAIIIRFCQNITKMIYKRLLLVFSVWTLKNTLSVLFIKNLFNTWHSFFCSHGPKKTPVHPANNETGAPAGFVSGTCVPFRASKAAQFLAICSRLSQELEMLVAIAKVSGAAEITI
jgi:hypothetical protein